MSIDTLSCLSGRDDRATGYTQLILRRLLRSNYQSSCPLNSPTGLSAACCIQSIVPGRVCYILYLYRASTASCEDQLCRLVKLWAIRNVERGSFRGLRDLLEVARIEQRSSIYWSVCRGYEPFWLLYGFCDNGVRRHVEYV